MILFIIYFIYWNIKTKTSEKNLKNIFKKVKYLQYNYNILI